MLVTEAIVTADQTAYLLYGFILRRLFLFLDEYLKYTLFSVCI